MLIKKKSLSNLQYVMTRAVIFMLLYFSMYCLCVNVYYCHRVTTQLQLTNISYHIKFAGPISRAV
jgi:hypothetical protein